MESGQEITKDFTKGPIMNGPSDAEAIAVDEPESNIKDGSDTSSEKGSQDETIAEKTPIMKRRVFEKGFLLVPFAIIGSLLLIGVAVAIIIPTTYMGICPPLTQKAVDKTYISLHNIRVQNWSYTQVQPTNTCEPYFPNFMNIYMDVKFEKLPWYVQLGPLFIEPGALGVYYNNTRFATLYQPQFDLTDPSDNIKWQNNTKMVMQVDNVLEFLNANSELLDLGSLTQGWTIWNQNGPVMITYKMLGIKMHYSAYMNQDVNVTRPQFLDGPMATVQDNIFDALICIHNAQENSWSDSIV